MHVGIFDHVERQKGRSLRETYDSRLRMARVADDAGFFCYHIAEHHGTPLSLTPSPNLLLTAMAQHTRQIHLGPLCYVLPLYNPIRLIEEVCMVDQITGGRLEIGVGRGVSAIEMSFLGAEIEQARDQFAEAFEILMMGLEKKSVNFEGKFYSFHEVPIDVDAVQQPHPPLWYPTSGTASLKWVATQGMHTVFQGSVDEVGEQVAIYQENAGPAGRTAERKIGLARYVFVAESEAEAMAVGEAAYDAHRDHLNYLRQSRGAPARAGGSSSRMPGTLGEAIASGWAAVGTAEAVTEQLQSMLDATGCNYLVYNPLLGSTPIDWACASVELFAAEVMPHV